MNGFEPSNNLFNTMMSMQGHSPGPSVMQNGPDNMSPSTSPSPGSSLHQMLQQNPELMNNPRFQLMIQQAQAQRQVQMAMSGVSNGGGGSNIPSQIESSRLSSSLNAGMNQSSQPHGSPPGVIGSGSVMTSGGSSFLSQSQNQPPRPHSPMQNLSGRPNSAPSVQPVDQSPGPIGPPQRSGSPMSSRTPPLEMNKQYQPNIQPIGGERIQPIGGERKRAAPARPGPSTNSSYGHNLWGFNNTSGPSNIQDFNQFEPSNMQYDGTGISSGDGDHNNINHASNMMVPGIYGNNGPYAPNVPMGHMFPPKSGAGDSQNPPMWNSNLTPAPSDHGDNERWQTWSQQAEM